MCVVLAMSARGGDRSDLRVSSAGWSEGCVRGAGMSYMSVRGAGRDEGSVRIWVKRVAGVLLRMRGVQLN